MQISINHGCVPMQVEALSELASAVCSLQQFVADAPQVQLNPFAFWHKLGTGPLDGKSSMLVPHTQHEHAHKASTSRHEGAPCITSLFTLAFGSGGSCAGICLPAPGRLRQPAPNPMSN